MLVLLVFLCSLGSLGSSSRVSIGHRYYDYHGCQFAISIIIIMATMMMMEMMIASASWTGSSGFLEWLKTAKNN